jgi:hypothetical protein
VLEVAYDPAVTTPEALCAALDTLLETTTSTPGILDECGNPDIYSFEVLDYDT